MQIIKKLFLSIVKGNYYIIVLKITILCYKKSIGKTEK